jgi:hypothetical protein
MQPTKFYPDVPTGLQNESTPIETEGFSFYTQVKTGLQDSPTEIETSGMMFGAPTGNNTLGMMARPCFSYCIQMDFWHCATCPFKTAWGDG